MDSQSPNLFSDESAKGWQSTGNSFVANKDLPLPSTMRHSNDVDDDFDVNEDDVDDGDDEDVSTTCSGGWDGEGKGADDDAARRRQWALCAG